MLYKKSILFLTFLFALLGCEEEIPTLSDGSSEIRITAVWDSSYNSANKLIPAGNARIILVSEYGTIKAMTNSNGVLVLDNLPASNYIISVTMNHPVIDGIILTGSGTGFTLNAQEIYSDTIQLKPTASSGLVINEIYFTGPVNSTFYIYDQYIELYNSSDSVKYLDGMMIMRFSGNGDEGQKGPGADENNDGDIDGVSNIYKFPGEPGEKNYGINPKSFAVLSVDAIDHSKIISSSLDLSKSDWEFYNQFSADDINNPEVPNLINLRPEVTVDFILNINSDIIAITKGNDKNWSDGIDINDIIDAVEYQPIYDLPKTLDERLDRSFVISPAKYSGKSIQRREVGLDTNNGLFDWEIKQVPTVGFQ
ncbi:MAG: DUF4876 domain-containing protein [Ignavibacteriales bacterium]|nr:MAG: DUF4876 domain-containing protein [Ignavibacteriales bacterium]